MVDLIVHIIVLFLILSLLTFSVNITLGYMGYLSLCIAFFFGIGSYLYAILTLQFGINTILSFFLTILFGFLLALFVSTILFKFKDDLFVIISLGIQLIGFGIFNNWQEVTNGPGGIAGIQRFQIINISNDPEANFLFTVLTISIVVFTVVRIWLTKNNELIIKAIREDELLAETDKLDTLKIKVFTYSFSASLAVIAGILYAQHSGFIYSNDFDLYFSIIIVLILVLGGSGNWSGTFIGVTLYILIPEALKVINISNIKAGFIRNILFGIGILLILRYKPSGIIGEFNFFIKRNEVK